MRLLLCGLLLLLLGGCATRGPLSFDCPGFARYTHPPLMTELEKEIHKTTAGSPILVGSTSSQPSSIQQQLVNSLSASASTPQSPGILLLSGGGQWGAYGAGFLNSLRKAGKLPEFPVVTGVSTGAMQALFVGVGDEAAYESLLTRYSPKAESEIVKRNPAPLALVTGSFAGLSPLKHLLEEQVCARPDTDTNCLLDRLAALNGRRKILLGFVDAHSGQFRFVDAVELANLPNRNQARTCIVGAALASAGMPVTFQQIRVDKKTYYDGGVRLSAFEAGIAVEAERAARMLLTAPGLVKNEPATEAYGLIPLYVLRNGPTIVQEADEKNSPDQKADALTAALRAEAIAVNQLEVQSIASLRLAHPTGAVLLATANGTGCVKPSNSMFNPDFMQCLRAAGARKGASPAPWKELPPLKTELRIP